jgi:osmotically-inducible protein OsmY
MNSLKVTRKEWRAHHRRLVVWSGIAGATLEYFFDPNRGRARRTILRDRLGASARHARRRISSLARYWEKTLQARCEEMLHLHHPDNLHPDDGTLKDRIQTEVLGDPTVHKGLINIDVVCGVVELRGQLASVKEIEEVHAKIRAVRGVRTIHSFLHVRGTPAPNKAEAIALS